jgi:hypothetical protein
LSEVDGFRNRTSRVAVESVEIVAHLPIFSLSILVREEQKRLFDVNSFSNAFLNPPISITGLTYNLMLEPLRLVIVNPSEL